MGAIQPLHVMLLGAIWCFLIFWALVAVGLYRYATRRRTPPPPPPPPPFTPH